MASGYLYGTINRDMKQIDDSKDFQTKWIDKIKVKRSNNVRKGKGVFKFYMNLKASLSFFA